MLEENNYSNPPTQELTPLPSEEKVQDNINFEKLEKKEIRKIAMAIGVPALFLIGISYAVTFGYIIISTLILGFSYNDSLKFLNEPAVLQVLQILLSCLMFLIPFALAVKCIGKRIDQTINFGLPKKGTAIPLLLLGVGFCSFSNIASSYSSAIFEKFGIEYVLPDSQLPSGIFGFLLTLISTAVVPAMVEEFACRGIVLGLLKKHGEAFAIITSAIFFGVMHGNFEQIPFATLIGLVLGYIYVKTGTIWIGVVVHFINNAVSVICAYLETIMPTNLQNLSYLIYLIAALLAAIVGIFMLTKSNENFELEKAEGTVTAKQKYVWFFTSWTIVLFILSNFIEALAFFDFSGMINAILQKVGF